MGKQRSGFTCTRGGYSKVVIQRLVEKSLQHHSMVPSLTTLPRTPKLNVDIALRRGVTKESPTLNLGARGGGLFFIGHLLSESDLQAWCCNNFSPNSWVMSHNGALAGRVGLFLTTPSLPSQIAITCRSQHASLDWALPMLFLFGGNRTHQLAENIALVQGFP